MTSSLEWSANDAGGSPNGFDLGATKRLGARSLVTIACAIACLLLAPGATLAFGPSFIGSLHTVSPVGSTVPGNEDVNPYGVAVVRQNAGLLRAGDILVSNFNNSENLQGTGSTIVELTPGGSQSLFAQISPSSLPAACGGSLGLTTALAVLPDDYVVVGNLPSSNGEAATAKAGCLIVLNSAGHVVGTLSGPLINGPWDTTAVPGPLFTTLFVTNVLNGTVKGGGTPTPGGTVLRIVLATGLPAHPPLLVSEQLVATGFPEATNEEAFVLGPTGVGLGFGGTLYVADTFDNRIAAVPFALVRPFPVGHGGHTVTANGALNAPLGLAIAPNGDVLTANGGNGNLVETTPLGFQFPPLDTGAGKGGLFGLAVAPNQRSLYFVNDSENTLELLH